jgi:hypothetical protein
MLGARVKYFVKVGETVETRLGQVISMCPLKDPPKAKSVGELLKSLSDQRGLDHWTFIRPYRELPSDPSTGISCQELHALWDREDVVHPESIFEVIQVSTTVTPGIPYFCAWASVGDGVPAVPITELPLHPTDQFTFNFERLRRLPSHVPILRKPDPPFVIVQILVLITSASPPYHHHITSSSPHHLITTFSSSSSPPYRSSSPCRPTSSPAHFIHISL